MFSSDKTQNEVTESDSKLFSCDRTRSEVSQSRFNLHMVFQEGNSDKSKKWNFILSSCEFLKTQRNPAESYPKVLKCLYDEDILAFPALPETASFDSHCEGNCTVESLEHKRSLPRFLPFHTSYASFNCFLSHHCTNPIYQDNHVVPDYHRRSAWSSLCPVQACPARYAPSSTVLNWQRC